MSIFRFMFAAAAIGTALPQVPPQHPFFNGDAVHEIYLTFSQPDWYDQLASNYSKYSNSGDIPYIEATFKWGDVTLERVGARFKGNASYKNASTKKKPFHIKFNEFVSGQKLNGMNGFVLSNAWSDPSFVRENAYYTLAAQAGLVCPRSNFAALYVNGTYWGLYVLGEPINGDFLKNHFGKADSGGNLYKGNIGATFEYLGADASSYKKVWEKQSNEEADDWTDLMELTRILNETSSDQLRAKLESLVDIDSVLTALAIDNLTANTDSYMGMNQNFYIYRRPSDSRWVWIPWDPSLAFAGLANGMSTQQLRELNIFWNTTSTASSNTTAPTAPGGAGGGRGGMAPGGGGGMTLGSSSARPMATKLWAVAEFKERYLQIYRHLAESIFSAGSVIERMNNLRSLIRPWVQNDTQKLVTMDAFESAMGADSTTSGTTSSATVAQSAPGAGMGSSSVQLQPFLTARAASVKSQLAEQAASAVMTVAASPASLTFTQQSGGKAPAAQTVTVTIANAPAVAYYTVSATAIYGTSWLSVTPAGGSIPGTITVSVDGTKLETGSYPAMITISSAGASNSPVTIPVVLKIT